MPKTTRDREHLSDEEAAIFNAGACPDCGTNLLQGPSGGGSQNFYCAGRECGSGFNEMGPFGIDRITNASPRKGSAGRDLQNRIERDRREFGDLVSRASNDELENALKYGQLGMSRWKAEIIFRQLEGRRKRGIVQTKGVGAEAFMVKRPTPAPLPEPRKTAWQRLLDDPEDK